jgi:uncharacterized hydrophobic protein (TIGR00341 family)
MKKILATARKGDLDNIDPALKDAFHSLKKEGNIVRFTMYVNDAELDDILGKLQETIDLRCKESMIEVYTPDFVISTVLSRSEEKAAEEKPPVEKLIDSTKPHTRLDTTKIALTSVAGMIALTGLFLNNVAIIIGAMLLSPLMGPIYAFAINTAVGKARYVVRSLINLGILLGMAIFFSFLTTLVISHLVALSLTPEIIARMDSNFIYTLTALFLGFASIFALSRDISESIAGVAIAAALLPPAVVTGICLALCPSRAAASFVLVLENILGLMAGSLVAILMLRIGPRRYYNQVVARRFMVRTSIILVALLGMLFILSCFL